MKRVVLGVILVVFSGRDVRAAAPAGQYTVQAEVVRDNKSGLTWQRGHSSAVAVWAAAGAYCGGLSLGGLSSGWRLPSAFELETLVDVRATDPAIDANAFPDTPIDAPYWSSTADAALPGASTWVLYLDKGTLHSRGRSDSDRYWVRCVHQ